MKKYMVIQSKSYTVFAENEDDAIKRVVDGCNIKLDSYSTTCFGEEKEETDAPIVNNNYFYSTNYPEGCITIGNPYLHH